MDTGRTIALIKALGGSGGGGGGGGSEEQFTKVYEEALASPTAFVEISSADMGGSYVDVLVYMFITMSYATDTMFVDFCCGEDTVFGYQYQDHKTGLTGVTSANGIITGWATDASGQCVPYIPTNSSSILYPTSEISGIDTIAIELDSEEENTLPAGTTITVYARKRVA